MHWKNWYLACFKASQQEWLWHSLRRLNCGCGKIQKQEVFCTTEVEGQAGLAGIPAQVEAKPRRYSVTQKNLTIPREQEKMSDAMDQLTWISVKHSWQHAWFFMLHDISSPQQTFKTYSDSYQFYHLHTTYFIQASNYWNGLLTDIFVSPSSSSVCSSPSSHWDYV